MTPASYWKQVREAEAKATPGPWRFYPKGYIKSDDNRITAFLSLDADGIVNRADGEFIALSREAIVLALARIEELEAALREINAGWSCVCYPRPGQCPTCIARAALGVK